MDYPKTRNSSKRLRRRDDAKRRGVEAAVERLICHYGLPPDRAQRLSEGIHDLYRDLVAQKSLDLQIRNYGKAQRRAERALAARTANASDCESEYVADAREFAARMIRLDNLEKRNLGRGRAIELAGNATWDELRPQERRKARQYLAGNIHPGDKVRQPRREVQVFEISCEPHRESDRASNPFQQHGASLAPGETTAASRRRIRGDDGRRGDGRPSAEQRSNGPTDSAR